MQRRAVLASVAALAAGSGCARLLGDGAVDVRVMRAPSERASDASRHCTIQRTFVESHEVLERVLASAKSAPEGEWVTTDTSRKQGEILASDLREHCGSEDAIYHYDGGNFVVRVATSDERLFPRNATDSGGDAADSDGDETGSEGDSTGSEAIRGAPTDERS